LRRGRGREKEKKLSGKGCSRSIRDYRGNVAMCKTCLKTKFIQAEDVDEEKNTGKIQHTSSYSLSAFIFLKLIFNMREKSK
jgi:hypothetical protein